MFLEDIVNPTAAYIMLVPSQLSKEVNRLSFFGVVPENRFGPDLSLGMGKTKQTKVWLWVTQRDIWTVMAHTDQTEDWVWARPNKPKVGYGKERTDPTQLWGEQNWLNSNMGKTEQIHFSYGSDSAVGIGNLSLLWARSFEKWKSMNH